jgi:putative DNA primase/helicase
VQELGDDWTRARADEVIAHLRDASPDLLERPPLDVINCRNGLLHLDTGKLAVLPSDVVAVAIELAGYLAVPDNTLQRAVMAVGAGANGKSTWTATLTAFLGEQNVATVPLHKLDEDRFAVASLYGRLANIFPDLDARALRSSSVFKAITGGDRLEAERKFRAAFSFTPYARLVFSANTVPPTSDSSEGFFRRWLVLPFERRFDPGQRDLHLLAKLTTPRELSGLLNLAVPALANLRTRGDFTSSASTAQAADEFRVSADSVSGFLDEMCTVDPAAAIAQPRLVAAYREWCATNGRAALGTARFNERLVSLIAVERRASRGVRRWQGVQLGEGER